MSRESKSSSHRSKGSTTTGKQKSVPQSVIRPRDEPAETAVERVELAAGATETEFGVPFAGEILPPEQWAKTAVKRLPATGHLDFAQMFGRDGPHVLDIGCGNGRFLLSSAVRRPHVDHIGIDSLPMVIRYATRRANMRGLTNCRLAVCDGHKFLRQLCPPASLNEIHVYHPQPYANQADHGLRLFDHEFLWLVHRSLADGGRLYVQTDNAAYWNYLQQVLPVIAHWHVQEGVWPEDPQGRSRREIVALNKGLTIYRGWGNRVEQLDPDDFAARCSQLPQPAFSAAHNRNPRHWRRSDRRRNSSSPRRKA